MNTVRTKLFWFALIAVLLAVWLTADAQQPARAPKIGFLSSGSATRPWRASFQREFEKLGYVDGKNVNFIHRFADTNYDRLPALAIQPLLITSIGQGRRIAELAAKNRLPTISDSKDFLDAGGLLSYGSDRLALWRRAAWYVDKILKGANPAELPVEQPTKFEFVVNLKSS